MSRGNVTAVEWGRPGDRFSVNEGEDRDRDRRRARDAMEPTDVSAVVDQQWRRARGPLSSKAFAAAQLLPPHADQAWMPELHVADPGTAAARRGHAADDALGRSRVFCRTSPRTEPLARRPRTPPLFLNNAPVSLRMRTHASASANLHHAQQRT